MVASKSSCPTKFVVQQQTMVLLFVALFVWMGESKNQVSKQLAGPIQAFPSFSSSPSSSSLRPQASSLRSHNHPFPLCLAPQLARGSLSSANRIAVISTFSLSSFAKRQHTRYYLPTYLYTYLPTYIHTYLQVGSNEKGPKHKIQK